MVEEWARAVAKQVIFWIRCTLQTLNWCFKNKKSRWLIPHCNENRWVLRHTWTDLFTFVFLLISFQIREACQDLILDEKKLREIMSKFLHEIERGLKKQTHPQADVKCFVTYVQDLPNGKGDRFISRHWNEDFSIILFQNAESSWL